jgi:hypothetical protein
MTTQLRGTIIRTPDSSPGLLVVGGQQKTFRAAIGPTARAFATHFETLMKQIDEPVASKPNSSSVEF